MAETTPLSSASSQSADERSPRIVHDDYRCGRTSESDGVLLAPGITSNLTAIAGREGDRVLAYTHYGWTLWNTRTRQVIAEGESNPAGVLRRPAMAGDVALVRLTGDEAMVLDVRDGRALKSMLLPGAPRISEMGIAVDGSYGWTANRDNLVTLFSLDGARIATLSARVSHFDQVSAQPSALRVSKLWAIDQVSIPEGTATPLVSQHEGTFKGWFTDGEHFIALDGANLNDQTLYVYRSDGQLIHTLPLTDFDQDYAGGHGRYFWTTHENTLHVYRIGSPEPLLRRPLLPTRESLYPDELFARGGEAAFISRERGSVLRLDMRGDELIFDELKFPVSNVGNYASDGTGRWTISGNGVVYDSQTRDDDGRMLPLGCGIVNAIAGARSGITAVATADRRVRVFDLNAPRTPSLTLEHETSEAALSSDGRFLLLSNHSPMLQHVADRAPRVLSLPAGKLLNTFPYSLGDGMTSKAITLSESGNRVAQLFCSEPPTGQSLAEITCAVQLSDVAGGQPASTGPLKSARLSPPANPFVDNTVRIALSPSGSRLAVSVAIVPEVMTQSGLGTVTVIFEGGMQTGSVRAPLGAWLDDERLLVSNPERIGGSVIVDYTGKVITEVPIRSTAADLLRVDAAHVYSKRDARIYTIPDGRIVWQGGPITRSTQMEAGIVGDRLVFQTGTEVRFARWTDTSAPRGTQAPPTSP